MHTASRSDFVATGVKRARRARHPHEITLAHTNGTNPTLARTSWHLFSLLLVGCPRAIPTSRPFPVLSLTVFPSLRDPGALNSTRPPPPSPSSSHHTTRHSSHPGADLLATAINTYFADMIHTIVAFGGDVYKFAGDALIVVWKGADVGTVANAVRCGMQLKDMVFDILAFSPDVAERFTGSAIGAGSVIRAQAAIAPLTLHCGLGMGDMLFAILGGVADKVRGQRSLGAASGPASSVLGVVRWTGGKLFCGRVFPSPALSFRGCPPFELQPRTRIGLKPAGRLPLVICPA